MKNFTFFFKLNKAKTTAWRRLSSQDPGIRVRRWRHHLSRSPPLLLPPPKAIHFFHRPTKNDDTLPNCRPGGPRGLPPAPSGQSIHPAAAPLSSVQSLLPHAPVILTTFQTRPVRERERERALPSRLNGTGKHGQNRSQITCRDADSDLARNHPINHINKIVSYQIIFFKTSYQTIFFYTKSNKHNYQNIFFIKESNKNNFISKLWIFDGIYNFFNFDFFI